MKNRKTIYIFLISLVILVITLFCLWFFIWRNKSPNSSGLLQPYLELTIKEFPQSIDTVCERVEFVLEAKNTGTDTIKYSDIEVNDFSFSLVQDGSRTIIGSTHSNAQGFHNLYIEDFGSIGVGQTKELVFYTKEAYMESYGFGFQNGFNMLQSYGNGISEYYFEFQRVNSENSYTVLSNLPKVSIDIQAFEYSGSMWSNKICD